MSEKIYSFEDIENYFYIPIEKAKKVVLLLGIVPAYVRSKRYYFSGEQVQLIVENHPRHYDKEIILESKMNYENNSR